MTFHIQLLVLLCFGTFSVVLGRNHYIPYDTYKRNPIIYHYNGDMVHLPLIYNPPYMHRFLSRNPDPDPDPGFGNLGDSLGNQLHKRKQEQVVTEEEAPPREVCTKADCYKPDEESRFYDKQTRYWDYNHPLLYHPRNVYMRTFASRNPDPDPGFGNLGDSLGNQLHKRKQEQGVTEEEAPPRDVCTKADCYKPDEEESRFYNLLSRSWNNA